MGIEQPGFLLGSQYLLPWDLPPDEAWAPEPKNAWRGKRSVRLVYLGLDFSFYEKCDSQTLNNSLYLHLASTILNVELVSTRFEN